MKDKENTEFNLLDLTPEEKLVIALFNFNFYINTNEKMHFKNYFNNILSMDKFRFQVLLISKLAHDLKKLFRFLLLGKSPRLFIFKL